MMMHASDQSDTVSLQAQSWPASPKRSAAVYYVQSPSRDSQESSTNQCTPTPTSFRSPADSPSLFGARSSRASTSASRVSGGGKPRHIAQKLSDECRRWRVIEEGGGGEYYVDATRSCHVWGGVMGFVGVFSLFCLFIWGASRPFVPQIWVKRLIVHEFYTGEGSDSTGVPTKVLTVNSSVTMRVHNPATFFSIHVTSLDFNLTYYDLVVASGQMKGYYQPRLSWRYVDVSVKSNELPLYGASTGFSATKIALGVPMNLVFELQTRGRVVGKLLKSKHQLRVSCSLAINANYPTILQFHRNSCLYH